MPTCMLCGANPGGGPLPCTKPLGTTPGGPTTTKVPQTNPATREYEIATIRKGGYDYPDSTLVKWPGLACIPLPTEWSMRQPGVATMRGPTSPPNAEDAMSYDELWFGFTIGRTIPDPFRRLFQAIGTNWAPNEAHDTALGYGLVRHISHIHAG